MQDIRKIGFYFFISLSTILIILTLLSLIYDLSFWYSKILDFPRQQYLLLGIVFLLSFILLNKKWNFSSFFLLSGLLAVITIHGWLIFPYFFGKKSVPDYAEAPTTTDAGFDVIIANVLITNRKSSEFMKMVKERDPDLLLAMEVDEWWVEELQVLQDIYPYQMEYPLDNAYGMLLYSKLPLSNKEIMFLKHGDVPSFHTSIELPSQQYFTFHAVHPVAPVPSNRYPDNVDEEEVALLKIGDLVASDSLPSIVAGDFNDVSWSYTSRMFGKKGKLRNVRIGRGIYNTFDATSPILRWPLDHYFVTQEFALVELERLPSFGSDHFPLYAKFILKE